MESPPTDFSPPAGGDADRSAHKQRLEANDRLIRQANLDNGRQIATERAAIFADSVRHWAQGEHLASGYDRPFAVVALGGTGRAELTPRSDLDFAFLFDDQIEGNAFLLGLQEQIVNTDQFSSRFGFTFEPLPFDLDDADNLHGKQLNAFLDMAPVYDPDGLAPRFRERIRANYDPFEHFLHVRDFWSRKWAEAADASENIKRFDIKNEGLRIFLAAVWALAGKDFSHSHTVYAALPDPRDLEAYDFLLRIRAFVHSRRGGTGKANLIGDHPEDLLEFDDFLSFGDMLGPEEDEGKRFEFGNKVRARLLASRRRISRFAKGVFGRELSQGVRVAVDSPIRFGSGGLFRETPSLEVSAVERSRRALELVLISQHYSVPIDDSELQNTFHNAGDWITRVPGLASLFYDLDGSLARSLDFLCQIDGVGERLFPGYALYEVSLDARVRKERESLRGKLSRRKLELLELLLERSTSESVQTLASGQTAGLQVEVTPEVEASLLDPDQIAAIRLALFTKRLPLTEGDLLLRNDESANLYQRSSSGLSQIPVEDYFQPFIDEPGFSEHTIELVKFLITNRRALTTYAEPGILDEDQVAKFEVLCRDPSRLRALYVFTCVDRAEWESHGSYPTRWFNIKELYAKTQSAFSPGADPSSALRAQGYDAEDVAILRDFGDSFYSGRYRRFANRFGPHVIHLAQDGDFHAPRVTLLRDDRSHILGVSARDNKGLAASICGVLWHNNIEVAQAHLFSASSHRLALDFFHLSTPPDQFPPRLTHTIEESILLTGEEELARDEGPHLEGEIRVQEWRADSYLLRFKGQQAPTGALYTLTRHLFLSLQANVFGLTARYQKGNAHVSIFFIPPAGHSKDELIKLASEILE